MIDSKKCQIFLMITLSTLATIGFLQNISSISNPCRPLYLYAYIGLLFVCALSFFLRNFLAKYSNALYVFTFIELHFIFLMMLLSGQTQFTNITTVLLASATIIIVTFIKGGNSPLIVSTFNIFNYLFAIILLTVTKNISTSDILYSMFDLVAIIISGVFVYETVKIYWKPFRTLEQAHIETTRNNQKLNESIAELSTLQEISRFSNSILNINSLIDLINDMIIGVIGVNYSSIFLIDDTTEKIYLEATNITNKTDLQEIKSAVLTNYLPQMRDNNLSLLEDNVSNSENSPVLNKRKVQNTLVALLNSRSRFVGVMIAESCFEGAFEERKKNMINTICNQVSIAIENAVLYDRMEKIATIDGLTKVHNRRYFNEVFLAEFSTIQDTAPLSVAMMDIDNFKKVNDTYGHLIGDDVLKVVSSIIKKNIDEADSEKYLVARYGGEEFVVLFRNTDINQSCVILEAIRKEISEQVVEDDEGQEVRFTISIGVAEYPSTSVNAKNVLQDADGALYKAKQSGKNRVVKAEIFKAQK